MQWQENCIILSTRLFSESSRIITLFNRKIGKTSGLVRGLKQPIHSGDIVDATWKGRTADQLGSLKIENIFSPFAHVFNSQLAILAMDSVCTLCLNGMPEKAPHPTLYDSIKSLFFSITQKDWLREYVFFEIDFLAEVGVGLDLSKCALTGVTSGLHYVSPKTGCAATKEAGDLFREKLFVLPKFITSSDETASSADIFSALHITGHFLKMYFCDINSRTLPLSRSYMIAALRENLQEVA